MNRCSFYGRRNERVAATAPGDGPASVVTIRLTEVDGRTEMRFHQYGVNTDQEHAEQAKAGWIEFFDRLAEQVD